MVTFLITSVLVVSLLAIAIYYWQKPANKQTTIELPPVYSPSVLFPETLQPPELPASDNSLRAALIGRANNGDLSALLEAKSLDDFDVYSDVLNAVVSQASQSELQTIAAHVVEHDLPASLDLVNAMIAFWEASPDKQRTSKMLHIAALSNDAELYDIAVQRALSFWREGKLIGVSTTDLLTLFNSEFWLLSSAARNSGAGFILKQALSSARRELEGITIK